MKRRLLLLASIAALMVPAGSATAVTLTTGTWTQYPAGAAEYQAEVQQPINTANTSNWSAKSKGGIPVMFKLSSRQGPAAFESIYGDASTANDFAYASFDPAPEITFSQLANLSTDYAFTLGDCHGGSLRWQVRIDADNDGVRDPYKDGTGGDNDPSNDVPATGDPALFVYYGAYPNFTDCTTANQSGVNMLSLGDLRFDTSQFNWHADFGAVQGSGTFYDSYADALALFGNRRVINATLVVDSGWGGNQRLTVSNTAANDNVYQFVSAGGGAFAPTCDLPAATIQVGKSDPVVDGAINEAPVQPSLVDEGGVFRQVDCKYQYVLSIPSLAGSGTYYVEIEIDGVTVPTPASPGGKVKFDLK